MLCRIFDSGIISIGISVLSIILVFCTYKEQRWTNMITQFESAFWILRDAIDTGNLSAISRDIANHFHGSLSDINRNQCVFLLCYYWRIHSVNKVNKVDSVYSIVYYTLTDTRISSEEKKRYMELLYRFISEDDYFCLLSYICHLAYLKQDKCCIDMIIAFPHNDLKGNRLEIYNKLTNKAEDVEFNSYDEFYGYYENATESYKETLNKFLNI